MDAVFEKLIVILNKVFLVNSFNSQLLSE